jgi:hypothetical protein
MPKGTTIAGYPVLRSISEGIFMGTRWVSGFINAD